MVFIKTDNLELKYHDKKIFDSTTFQIEENQTTAIIGANGAGKTSFLKIILGELKQTSGNFVVTTNKISYVPQNFNYTKLEYINAKEFIKLGINGNKFGICEILKKSEMESIDKYSKHLGIEKLLDRRMSELSGGEIQKVAICLALVSNPDTLLLDEPFSALDFASIKEITGVLLSLKTIVQNIVIIVHDINPILHLIDGCIYFIDGHGHYMRSRNHQDHEKLAHIYSSLTSITHNDDKVEVKIESCE